VRGLAAATAAFAFVALFSLERMHPLRRRAEPGLSRVARNLALGGLSAALVLALQWLTLRPFVSWAEAQGLGLLPLFHLPRPLDLAAGVLLLDYTLWHWHRWNHVLPLFWRFHLVHHVDRDLDASTGLRFHVGEMTLSIVYRAAQVAALGASALALDLWSGLLLVSVLFHHSNLRLPLGLEKWLVRVVVTPRMHGIHHSERRDEVDTNFSSLFSCWDLLHGTLRLDVPQARVVVGVPAHREPGALGFWAQLALPFRRQGDSWPGQPRPPRTARRAVQLQA
jgi:sterol desaturase/sphingolipid hydroxylase (fatty acid hydroxylase superfamily)